MVRHDTKLYPGKVQYNWCSWSWLERGCIRAARASVEQYKEFYRLADTVMELTFVFLRVTFPSWFPFLTVLARAHKRYSSESTDSVRPIYYSTSDRRVARTPTFSPRSSFTHAHRCIGPHNVTSPMVNLWPARLMYLGPRNTTRPIPQPVRLMYLSVSDSVCEPAPSPSPRSTLKHDGIVLKVD